MKNLTPTQKLDEVLLALTLPEGVQRKYAAGINDYLHQKTGVMIGTRMVESILKKLERDGYASSDREQLRGIADERGNWLIDQQLIKYYFITFEGELFLQKQGYTQQKADEDLKRYSKYAQAIALVTFSATGAIWAAVQIYDRLQKCCGCHH